MKTVSEMSGKDAAIRNAMTHQVGQSFSDGNMMVGIGPNHVAVNFNQTTYNENNLVVMQDADARALFILLAGMAKAKGWME